MKISTVHKVSDKHPFWSKVAVGADDECWLWRGNIDQSGYGYMGKNKAHRLAWEIFNRKQLLRDQVIRHQCDTPMCCNPLHLHSGQHQDNLKDRVERDRSAKGEANGRSKLTEIEVLEVYASAGSYSEIGKQFAISKWSVRDIKAGKNWGWLTSISHGGKFKAKNTIKKSRLLYKTERQH